MCRVVMQRRRYTCQWKFYHIQNHATKAHTLRQSIENWHAHDDVIKWKHFPRYWPFVREIHRSPVNFPHKGQWRGALMFTLICARMNGWVNNHEAGDLRRYLAHYDVIVMLNVQEHFQNIGMFRNLKYLVIIFKYQIDFTKRHIGRIL